MQKRKTVPVRKRDDRASGKGSIAAICAAQEIANLGRILFIVLIDDYRVSELY